MQAVDLFVEEITKRILSRTYEAGSKLPTERELITIFNYSRQTIHNGLIKLSEIGLIKIVPRHGVWVLDYKTQTNFKILDALIQMDKESIESSLKSDIIEFFEYHIQFMISKAMKNPYDPYLETLLIQLRNTSDLHACQSMIFEFFHCLSMMSHNQVVIMMINSFREGIENASYYLLDSEIKPVTLSIMEAIQIHLQEKNPDAFASMNQFIQLINQKWRLS
ncbi:MAG: FadR family transcriptional regulator [Clostridia bacterium]|nr:FadR family transcriptional regulator [Clostridia bacterium]